MLRPFLVLLLLLAFATNAGAATPKDACAHPLRTQIPDVVASNLSDGFAEAAEAWRRFAIHEVRWNDEFQEFLYDFEKTQFKHDGIALQIERETKDHRQTYKFTSFGAYKPFESDDSFYGKIHGKLTANTRSERRSVESPYHDSGLLSDFEIAEQSVRRTLPYLEPWLLADIQAAVLQAHRSSKINKAVFIIEGQSSQAPRVLQHLPSYAFDHGRHELEINGQTMTMTLKSERARVQITFSNAGLLAFSSICQIRRASVTLDLKFDNADVLKALMAYENKNVANNLAREAAKKAQALKGELERNSSDGTYDRVFDPERNSEILRFTLDDKIRRNDKGDLVFQIGDHPRPQQFVIHGKVYNTGYFQSGILETNPYAGAVYDKFNIEKDGVTLNMLRVKISGDGFEPVQRARDLEVSELTRKLEEGLKRANAKKPGPNAD